MKKLFYLFASTLLGIGAQAQSIPFANEIAPSFGNTTVKFDPALFSGNYASTTDFLDILAISGDCTVYDKASNTFSPMKGNISSIYANKDSYANSSKQDSLVTIYASFDKNEKNQNLGDGGGAIFFKIGRKSDSKWQVIPITKVGKRFVYFQNIDFSSIGGTVNNNNISFGLGAYEDPNTGDTPMNETIIITEDYTQLKSNNDLIGFSDISDFEYASSVTKDTKVGSPVPAGTSLPKYLSLGWPIEVDAGTGEVRGRIHRFGRGANAITKARAGYYFMYPGNPSILMLYQPTQREKAAKYSLDNVSYYESGSPNLYAYKEDANGNGGFTIPIAYKVVDSLVPDPTDPKVKYPIFIQDFDSLLVAKEVALRAGATMFANIGDIVTSYDESGEGEIILLTEKGVDNPGDAYSNPAKKYNGVLANHLQALNKNGNFSDPYGRVLAIKNKVSVLTEGGVSKGNKFFSNPDKLEVGKADDGNKDEYSLILTVKENIPATDKGRNPTAVPFAERTNEAYYVQILAPNVGNNNYFPLASMDEVAPIAFDQYKLFETGSKGTLLSSSSNDELNGNTFLQNSKAQFKTDSYISLTNGYNGTDKSMIFVVNKVNTLITGFEAEEAKTNATTFAAWPNPSTGIVKVKDVSDYTVVDLSGNQVKSFTGTQEMDLSDLGKGMYFLKKTNGAVKKIVLQ